MKMSIVAAFATLLAVAVSTTASAAENVDRATWDAQQAQIKQLEAELSAIKSRLDTGVRPAAYTEYTTSTVAAANATSGFSNASAGCTSCGDAGCGDCDFGCHPFGFYGGAAAVWMKPHFEDNIALTNVFSTTGIVVRESVAFDYGYDVAPRIWLGYVADQGVGIRGQYWQFQQEAPQVVETVPASNVTIFAVASNLPGTILTQAGTFAPGEVVTASHNLNLEIADLEATKRIYGGRTTLVFSGGARYAQMRQKYSVQGVLGNNIRTALENDVAYDGIGPTLAMDLRRPLLNGGLALIGNARGSILFGTTTQRMESLDTTVGFIRGFHREEEVLSILETQWGLEWNYHLAANGRLFLAGTVEAQLWQGAGSSSLDSGDIGLIGFGLSAGLAR